MKYKIVCFCLRLFLSPFCFCHRGTVCNILISQEMPQSQPVIFNPDFYVEKLRHEKPQVFTELLLSNISRLIDLPGAEFAQLQGEAELKLPTSTGFLRLPNFLKRKGKQKTNNLTSSAANHLEGKVRGAFRTNQSLVMKCLVNEGEKSSFTKDFEHGYNDETLSHNKPFEQ